MAEDDFLGWLTLLETKFSSLTSTQQTQTINRLISRCGSDQLWLLQQRLPELLYRDFVRCESFGCQVWILDETKNLVSGSVINKIIHDCSLLPPELTERILSFLPASSLLACCQVENYLFWDQHLVSPVHFIHLTGFTFMERSSEQFEQSLAGSG